MLYRLLIYVVFALSLTHAICQKAAAQEPAASPPSLDQLEHLAGTWKATVTEDGQQRIQYLMFRARPDLNALAQWVFSVNSDSKQLEQVVFGFIGMPSRTNQIQGLVFTSDGMVAETMGTLQDKVLHMKGYGTLSSGARVSADIAYDIDSAGKLIQNWTDMMAPWGHSPEGERREFTKIDEGMRSLFRDGHIVAPQNVELTGPLARLGHLVGRWEGANADGNVQHNQNWHIRALGRWLGESWQLSNGNNGVNISGVDPATGRLTLWSINAQVIGRTGHWEILDENTVGQVQFGNRLTRELVKSTSEDMLVSRWQTLEGGGYVNTGNSYVVKRVSQPRDDSTLTNEQTTSSAVDYGEPRFFARIEYMQVPADGEELYFDVEKAWKKIHRARRAAGMINNWMLLKVSRPEGATGDYNYVVVHLSDSLERLRDGTVDELNLSFSDEEMAALNKTADARQMVRYDYWDLVSTADPTKIGQKGFAPTMLIGMMQSKNEARHWELEQTVWSKLWQQQVKDGHLWNWHLWRRRTGDGFNFVTVHMRPEGRAAAGPGVLSDEVREKALPDMTRSDLASAATETEAVRDMVGYEQWTLIDTLEE